ncbi:MAG: hypothetical protein ACREX8_12865 [Gammaproteobacteria bacterium]
MTAADGVAAEAPVLVAMWCCSVGANWTVELRELDPGTALGTMVDWISSGVPTTQPEPDEASVRELLADRGLHLYPDSAAGPCTYSRHSIGYVCRDAEVIALAHRMRDVAAAADVHPVMLAAQRIAAGLRIYARRADARDGQRLRTLRA